MSADPRIEAAAEELAYWDGWSRSLWPDRMNPDAAFSYRETAKAAIAAADKASSVTTVEELDALLVGSVVLSRECQSWQKVADHYWHAALWKEGSSAQRMVANLGPFKVLYRGQP